MCHQNKVVMVNEIHYPISQRKAQFLLREMEEQSWKRMEEILFEKVEHMN
jgi:hypothetical protein